MNRELVIEEEISKCVTKHIVECEGWAYFNFGVSCFLLVTVALKNLVPPTDSVFFLL